MKNFLNLLLKKKRHFFKKNFNLPKQYCQNYRQNTGKCEKNLNPSYIHKSLIFVNSLRKAKIKKSFLFHILRWRGFLMIPLTVLYVKYISRLKLCEQKTPFEYSSSLSTKVGVGTITTELKTPNLSFLMAD